MSWPALLLAALACNHAAADATLQFRIAALEGDGWRAEGLEFELHRDAAGRSVARVSIVRLELPPPVGAISGARGECRQLEISTRLIACGGLELHGGDAALPVQHFAGRLEYRRDTGALAWDLAAQQDGGRLRLRGAVRDGGWQLEVDGEGWPAESHAALPLPQDFPEITGRLDLSVVARGRQGTLHRMVFQLGGRQLALNNAAGTVATEGLDFELRGSAWLQGTQLAWDARGAFTRGEAYVEPVYVDLGEHPLSWRSRGQAGEGRVKLEHFAVEQPGVARASGSASLHRVEDGGWQLATASLRLIEATLPGAYAVLLQPMLATTSLGDLETAGSFHGELTLAAGAPESAWLELGSVDLDDRQGRLAVYGLSGDFAWMAAAGGPASAALRPMALRWSGGFVYGIPFGPAELRMEAGPARWAMTHSVSVPVLDGALEIATLEFSDFGTGGDTLRFDARLTPVSMRELSHALDWPPLSGQLSGSLPSLSYADGVLALGGELRAELFGGSLAIDGLQVDQPFGPLARLQAEITFRGIDLERLTEAFSFGLMTGPLDGHVRGLKLIDWAPVAFDARIHTPAGDRSRKRISQRAVDNIASLGGGGAGALSTGFLQFFENFSYDAFALGCRLERDVCEMSGLEPREPGYLILRGRGLPRIDVVGFATQVSWSTLIGQLASMLESEGPQVR